MSAMPPVEGDLDVLAEQLLAPLAPDLVAAELT
jgi:hypothetical protein